MCLTKLAYLDSASGLISLSSCLLYCQLVTENSEDCDLKLELVYPKLSCMDRDEEQEDSLDRTLSARLIAVLVKSLNSQVHYIVQWYLPIEHLW